MRRFNFVHRIQDAFTLFQSKRKSRNRRRSSFWPLIVILLTLNFMVARDAYMLNKRTANLIAANQAIEGPLRKLGEQTHFIDSFKPDLERIAPSDPVAAQLLIDFFPSPKNP